MPTDRDREFVKLAIHRGFVNNEMGRDILIRLSQAEKNKARMSVDRLMVMEEMLSEAQVTEIQEAQKRKLIFCVCGQKTNIFEFGPGSKVKCKRCDRIIEIP
ncbi:MAG: hypothetical protein ACYTHM_06860 [Planctomycetota bacterium]|jgi:hypothetical protein